MQASFDVLSVVQTITAAGVMGLIGWAFRFSARLTRLETVLLEPDLGVVPRVKGIAKQGHDHATHLQGHALQLEDHDRRLTGAEDDIARLDRDKESRRPLQPTDVGRPDRRSPA